METRSKKRRRLTEETQRAYEAETSAYSSLNCSFECRDPRSKESVAGDAGCDQNQHCSSASNDSDDGDAGDDQKDHGRSEDPAHVTWVIAVEYSVLARG